MQDKKRGAIRLQGAGWPRSSWVATKKCRWPSCCRTKRGGGSTMKSRRQETAWPKRLRAWFLWSESKCTIWRNRLLPEGTRFFQYQCPRRRLRQEGTLFKEKSVAHEEQCLTWWFGLPVGSDECGVVHTVAASCVVPLDDVAGRLGSRVCKDKLSTTVGCLGVTERNHFSATLLLRGLLFLVDVLLVLVARYD